MTYNIKTGKNLLKNTVQNHRFAILFTIFIVSVGLMAPAFGDHIPLPYGSNVIPIVEPIDDQILFESDNLYIPVRVINAHDHHIKLMVSSSGLGISGLVTIEDYGNGTGMITLNPSSKFIGKDVIKITALASYGVDTNKGTESFNVSIIDDPHFYQLSFIDYFYTFKSYYEWVFLDGSGLVDTQWRPGPHRPYANTDCYGCSTTIRQAFGTPLSVDIVSSRHSHTITSEPGMLQYSTDRVSWNTFGSIPGSSVLPSNTHYTLEKMDEPVYLRMAFLESQKYSPAIYYTQINYSSFPVVDLIVTPGSNFLDITWQDNPGTVYTIQVTPTGTSDKIEFTTDDNFITVSNLQPETQYDIVIIPDGNEEHKTTISQTTTSHHNTIQNLDAILSTISSRIRHEAQPTNPFATLEIRWDSYSFDTNYTVRITEHGSSDDVTEITTTDTFAEILTPTHGSKYTIVVLPDDDENAKSTVSISIPELDPDLKSLILFEGHVFSSESSSNLSDKQAQDGIVEFYNKLANTYTMQNTTDAEIIQDLDGLSVDEIQDFFSNYMHYSQKEIDELSIPDSNLAPSPHIPVFTIVGHIDAEDYDGIGSTSINGILVCAYDYNVIFDHYKIWLKHSGDLACDYTSPSGSYIIDNILNDDPHYAPTSLYGENINIDLAIAVISSGESDFVLKSLFSLDYPHPIGNLHLTLSDTTLNFNQTMQKIDVHPNGVNADAARIVDTISDGLDFFEGYGISSEDLTVSWDHRAAWRLIDTPEGSIPVYYPNSTGNYDPLYSFEYNIMFLNGDDAHHDLEKYDLYDNDSKVRYNILRQLGYHIADVANPKSESDCGDAVALYDKSDPKCAWLDGWASFVPHLVDDSSTLQINEKGHLVDLETEQITYANGTTLHKFPKTEIDSDEKQTHVGETVPGQIAATLWDIKDTPVHPTEDILGDSSDNLALGDDEIVENYATNPSADFKGFYHNWQADPYLTSNTTTIMKLHGMDFALNPKIPGILPPIVTPTSDAPNPISNLNVVSSENSIDVSWDAYENATEYTVYVAESKFADEQEITPENKNIIPEQLQTVTTETSTSVEVSKPDTEYAIAVVADDDVRTASRMHVTSDSTDTVETPPYTPKTIENLKASKTKSSFDITWDDNGAANYTIRVIEPGHFDDRVEFTTSANSTTVEDLKPQTQYKIIVAPEDDFDYKQMITKTTKVAPVLEGLDITLDGNFLEISWDDQPEVDEYMVRVIEQPDGYDDRLEYTTTNSTTTVSDLKLSTEYRIVVLPDGHEQPKAAAHITTSSSARTIDPPVTPTDPPTSTPDTVQNLNVTFTHNTISVTWDDDFANYEVRVFPVGEYTPGEFITANNYSVNNLNPDTDYRIVVVPDGAEDKKAAENITTLTEPPIENLLVTPTATSLDISWNPHDGATEYTVRVIEQPTGTSDRLEYTVSDTSKTVDNLNPDTEYRVVVLPKDTPQSKTAQHMTTLPSTSSPTDPPVTPTDPPVTPTDPPVTPTDPPVTPTDPPVTPTDPPVTPTDPPVTPTDPPVTPTDPPVTPTDPPVTPTDPPVTPTDPPVTPTDPPVTPTDPPTNPPDTVQNLDVTFTHNTISVTWDDDFTNYEVRVFPVGEYTPGEFITANNYSVNGLTHDTDYRIVVVPDGVEDKKAAKEITTLSPPPIENLLIAPTATSLDISWNPHDGTSEYTVRVIEQPTGTSDRLEYTVSDTSKTVDNLNPNTEYRVVVLPKDTPQSKTAQHMTTLPSTAPPVAPPVTPTDPPVTPTDPPTNPPDTVQNLDVTFTHNTISVTWDDDFTNYEVRVFPVGEYTPGEFITANNYSVNGLTHDTDYRIVVVPDGVEDKKAAKEITTLSPPPIENLLIAPTATSFDISWNPHDGTSEYTVRVIEQPTGTSAKIEYTITETSKTIENLNPNTEYRVVVFSKDMPQARAAQHITTPTSTSTSDPLPTDPPVTSTDPPVTPTDPPVTPTDPPVTPTDPPVTPTDPPTNPPDTVQNLDVTFTHNTISVTWDDDFTNYEVRVFPVGEYTPGEFITDNNYSVNGLTHDTDYRIVVVPDGVEDKKAAKEIRTLTLQSIQNLGATATDSSLSISWDDNGAAQYTVRVIQPGHYNDRVEKTTADNFIEIENLQSDTEYKLVVFASADEDTKSIIFTTTLTFTATQPAPQPQQDAPSTQPDAIQNLNVTFTHNTALATWDDDFDSYEVRVTAPGFQALGLSSDNSHNFDNLTPDTDYSITVAPDGDESKMATKMIRTLPLPTPPTSTPDIVQNLNVTFTHNTALATWDDDFDSYEVRVTAPGFQALGLSSDNSHNFDNLTPDTDYSITVAPDGDESKMATKMIRTLPLPTPPTSTTDTVQNLKVESTHNTIDISWDAYENATQYTISVIEQPTGTSAILKYIVTDTSKTIYALKPDTEYKFVVTPDDMSEIKAEMKTRTLTVP